VKSLVLAALFASSVLAAPKTVTFVFQGDGGGEVAPCG
jgi:hypothetical protein